VPRIKAGNIAEHVARQRAAVLDAGVRLFIERGYSNVGLGDIASQVGLARNSLYRYVPDKVHLLVEWYRRTVPATVDSWKAAVSGDAAAAQRLQRWAHAYLEWAATPEHQLIAPLTEALPTLDPETRADVAELHRRMMDVVARVVVEAGVPESEVSATVDLLAGLVLGAARAERRYDSGVRIRDRMDAAVEAIVADRSTSATFADGHGRSDATDAWQESPYA
jgi:AcrR family transcriptional regulator